MAEDEILQYQNIKKNNKFCYIQQNKKELPRSNQHNVTELDKKENNHKLAQDINEIEQGNMNDINLVAINSFQLRRKVLDMQLSVVKTFSAKQLFDKENNTLSKIQVIETCVDKMFTKIDIYNLEEAEKELVLAENLGTELMGKIKKAIHKNLVKKEEVKHLQDDIIRDIPDYRSIVTVRGTQEDVINCILKANKALENGNYNRAESLLLKAERILPTKNARDLLNQVRAAKEIKQNNELIKSTEENVTTIKKKEPISEYYSCATNGNIEKVYIPRTGINKRHENPKKEEVQMERQRNKEEEESRKSTMRINYQPNLNKTLEDQEYILINNKCKTKKQVKTDTDKVKFCKDHNNETENKIKSQDDDNFDNHARQLIGNGELNQSTQNITLQNVTNTYGIPSVKSRVKLFEKELTTSHFSSKYNAGLKTAKSSLNNEQVENDIYLDVKTIHDNKFQSSIFELSASFQMVSGLNCLDIVEDLHPKEGTEEVLHFDDHENHNDVAQFNITDVWKCIEKAQAAFQESQFPRAENLLLKSLRICETEIANSFMEIVRNAIAQNDTKVNAKIKTKYNGLVNKPMNEEINEYDKCVDVMSTAGNDLPEAECFRLTPVPTDPNEDAQKPIQDGASQHSTAAANIENNLKADKLAEIYVQLAIDSMTGNKIREAYFYCDGALTRRLNEETKELVQDIKIQIGNRNGCHPLSKHEISFEASKLLDKAKNLIHNFDFEKAESMLIVSWDMNRNRRTTLVYKELLETRLALFRRGNYYNSDGSNNSVNIYESDRLVKLALDKMQSNKFETVKMLLQRASDFHPSVTINNLLEEIIETKYVSRMY